MICIPGLRTTCSKFRGGVRDFVNISIHVNVQFSLFAIIFVRKEYIYILECSKTFFTSIKPNADNSARDTCLHVVVTEVAELLCC